MGKPRIRNRAGSLVDAKEWRAAVAWFSKRYDVTARTVQFNWAKNIPALPRLVLEEMEVPTTSFISKDLYSPRRECRKRGLISLWKREVANGREI